MINYNTSNINEIKYSKNEILSRVSEVEIYLRYLGFSPMDGTGPHKSPFTEDNNPSFHFYEKGEWLWTDFSSRNGGDCIHIVALIYSISYSQALQKIAKDLKVSNFKVDQSRVKWLKELEKATKEPSKIEVITREWLPEDIEYWGKYNLEIADIDNESTFIKPCKEVWINDKCFYNYKVDKDLCYRYLFNGYYKIYRPNNKKCKWVSNTGLEIVQNYNNINNYSKDIMIITKSYKDALCVNKIGYNSIAFGSETTINVDKVIDWLKSNFKHIVVFYDNDDSGVKYSRILCGKYNLSYIEIPKEYESKDISDYIDDYSFQEAEELLNSLL